MANRPTPSGSCPPKGRRAAKWQTAKIPPIYIVVVVPTAGPLMEYKDVEILVAAESEAVALKIARGQYQSGHGHKFGVKSKKRMKKLRSEDSNYGTRYVSYANARWSSPMADLQWKQWMKGWRKVNKPKGANRKRLTNADLRFIRATFPQMGGDQPSVFFNVRKTYYSKPNQRGMEGTFLNFDRTGKLLGWGGIMSSIKFPFNSAADGSTISLVNGQYRLVKPKYTHKAAHPDGNAELARKHGTSVFAVKGRKRNPPKPGDSPRMKKLRGDRIREEKIQRKRFEGVDSPEAEAFWADYRRRNSRIRGGVNRGSWQSVWRKNAWTIYVNTASNRVMVENENTGRTETPVDHGYQTRQPYARQIAYDRPEAVPKYVQKAVAKVFDTINAETGQGNRGSSSCKQVKFTTSDGKRVSFKSCK